MTKVKKRVDVMVDIETLGTDRDSTIFQIAAKTFNILGADDRDQSAFNMIADISVPSFRGLTPKPLNIDGETLKWWLDTDKELLHKLLHNGTGSPENLLRQFHSWLTFLHSPTTEVYMWGNGVIFDNLMLKTQMEGLGLEYPIYYRNDRDLRTLMETAMVVSNQTERELKSRVDVSGLVAHDAMDDVERQIRQAKHYFSELTKRA